MVQKTMKNYKKISVNDLIFFSREHDEDAFAELVERYTPMINKVIGSFSCDTVSPSELFSEACVGLHSAVRRYDLTQEKVTFGLYARVCVYNAVVDSIRRSAGADFISEDEDTIENLPDNASLENEIAAKESVEFLLKSAEKMLSDYEYSVLMYHIRGYRTADIARRLSRPAKSVDNAKARIFKRLRGAFGDITDF